MSIVTFQYASVKPPFGAIHERFDGHWEELILTLLGEPAKRSRAEWRYLCPLHTEDTPSFDFNVEKGLFHCFGCGESGDAIDLWAKLRHCQQKVEAAFQIAETFGIEIEETGKPPKLTLTTYAAAKRLDLARLKEWGLRDGEAGLEIPYLDEQGKEVAVRIRLAMRGNERFRWRPGDRPILYGLWRLKDFPHDRIYIVEGESDCHTLWQADLAALGLPGKTVWKAEWAKLLQDFGEIVIVEEPGARKEVLKIARDILREKGRPSVVALHLQAKDPSDLWRANPEVGQFRAALEEADHEVLDFSEPHIKMEWLCYTQSPIYYRNEEFRLPFPYYVKPGGDLVLLQAKGRLHYEKISPRLLIIGGRYRDEEGRFWTELTWKDAEGGWSSRLIERREALDKRTILELAAWGAPVSSENVGAIVRFLTDFEEENQRALAPQRASTRMGWAREGAAFILGEQSFGEKIKFIPIGEEERELCEAYRPKGKREEWKRLFESLPSALARFMVAAGFAAPLVRLLNERTALVYLYGETRLGKTAVVHLALSAWGNPEKLFATAFATPVAMERRAALFSDLPLGIDERQAATNERFVTQMVYMLSGGQSKGRGLKEGGLEAISYWRTIALMTGEEDLTESVWTGIETRTIQLHAYSLLTEELAREIYSVTKSNYGHIGPAFIQRVLEEGVERLRERCEEFGHTLKEGVGGETIDGAKQNLLAVIGTAEWILYEVLGLDREKAFVKALEDVGEIQTFLAQLPQESVVERVKDYILSKFVEFQAELEARFGKEFTGDDRAFIDEEGGGKWLCVLPTVFEKWLADGGFSKRRVLEDLAAKGWLKVSYEGGKRRCTFQKRSPTNWNERQRYYVLDYSAMIGEKTGVEKPEERSEAQNFNVSTSAGRLV